MSQIGFYRFIAHPAELAQLHNERKVQTTNPYAHGKTWYTTTRYTDPVPAQEELALPHFPSHRIGPIPEDEMSTFDILPRIVAPAFGQPGGGVEARVTGQVFVFGCWNFTNTKWEF